MTRRAAPAAWRRTGAGLAAALALSCPAAAPARAEWPVPAVSLDPARPNGADIFRAVCREAGFSGAGRALDAVPTVPVDFAPPFSVFATALASGGSAMRGDPAAKAADDVVVTLGTAEIEGVPFGTCSTFSLVTPLAALDALGATPEERAALAARAEPDDAFRIVPPILAMSFVGDVPGSRGVTVMTVAGTAPDRPGTVLSLDTVSVGGAIRIAGALAYRRLFPDPIPTYEDALRQATPGRPTPPSETRP